MENVCLVGETWDLKCLLSLTTSTVQYVKNAKDGPLNDQVGPIKSTVLVLHLITPNSSY